MSSGDPDDAFREAADELYALPPADFTAARNTRAKAARAEGDRDLAARIAALPRASVGAWLANVLVREAEDDLEQVLQIGAELRAAQSGSDRDRVRQLGTERRDLLAAVADRAAVRAEEVGRRVGPAALEELQQTLQAAMVDDDAARAVRTGRLVRALVADGLEPVELTNAVAGPAGLPAGWPLRLRPERSSGDGADSAAQAERARQRAAAEQRAADAERRARRTRSAADAAADAAAQAEEQVRQQEEAARDLRSRIEELRTALREAEQRLIAAERAAAEARKAADRAAQDADEAEREAEAATAQLRDSPPDGADVRTR